MGWYGDPDALDASSRGLGADAEGVRGRARALERSVASMRWQGAAATAFRRAVESDADALHRGVEAALLSALDGGSGVVAAATALEVRAGQLLVAVARYRAADALSEELVDVRRWLLGATAPVTLPLVLGAGFGWAAGVSAAGAALRAGGAGPHLPPRPRPGCTDGPRRDRRLENRHDVVPHLDGRENPDSDDHVTVLFDHLGATVGESHDTATAYLPAARQADASGEVSVDARTRSADAFLAGTGERTSATTTVYTVSNALPGR